MQKEQLLMQERWRAGQVQLLLMEQQASRQQEFEEQLVPPLLQLLQVGVQHLRLLLEVGVGQQRLQLPAEIRESD
jgi:hypothetical protein